ncbi:hypothetical protein AAMO2058_001427100 [Amorphochlora amoebiformis]
MAPIIMTLSGEQLLPSNLGILAPPLENSWYPLEERRYRGPSHDLFVREAVSGDLRDLAAHTLSLYEVTWTARDNFEPKTSDVRRIFKQISSPPPPRTESWGSSDDDVDSDVDRIRSRFSVSNSVSEGSEAFDTSSCKTYILFALPTKNQSLPEKINLKKNSKNTPPPPKNPLPVEPLRYIFDEKKKKRGGFAGEILASVIVQSQRVGVGFQYREIWKVRKAYMSSLGLQADCFPILMDYIRRIAGESLGVFFDFDPNPTPNGFFAGHAYIENYPVKRISSVHWTVPAQDIQRILSNPLTIAKGLEKYIYHTEGKAILGGGERRSEGLFGRLGMRGILLGCNVFDEEIAVRGSFSIIPYIFPHIPHWKWAFVGQVTSDAHKKTIQISGANDSPSVEISFYRGELRQYLHAELPREIPRDSGKQSPSDLREVSGNLSSTNSREISANSQRKEKSRRISTSPGGEYSAGIPGDTQATDSGEISDKSREKGEKRGRGERSIDLFVILNGHLASDPHRWAPALVDLLLARRPILLSASFLEDAMADMRFLMNAGARALSFPERNHFAFENLGILENGYIWWMVGGLPQAGREAIVERVATAIEGLFVDDPLDSTVSKDHDGA